MRFAPRCARRWSRTVAQAGCGVTTALNPSIHGIFTVKFGNVFAAVCFLQGLGYQRFLLDLLDPAFPVVIGAGIVKRQHQ
jgi:hypothetical protein